MFILTVMYSSQDVGIRFNSIIIEFISLSSGVEIILKLTSSTEPFYLSDSINQFITKFKSLKVSKLYGLNRNCFSCCFSFLITYKLTRRLEDILFNFEGRIWSVLLPQMTTLLFVIIIGLIPALYNLSLSVFEIGLYRPTYYISPRVKPATQKCCPYVLSISINLLYTKNVGGTLIIFFL